MSISKIDFCFGGNILLFYIDNIMIKEDRSIHFLIPSLSAGMKEENILLMDFFLLHSR